MPQNWPVNQTHSDDFSKQLKEAQVLRLSRSSLSSLASRYIIYRLCQHIDYFGVDIKRLVGPDYLFTKELGKLLLSPMYRLFCGGFSIDEALQLARKLKDKRIGTIFDYTIEHTASGNALLDSLGSIYGRLGHARDLESAVAIKLSSIADLAAISKTETAALAEKLADFCSAMKKMGVKVMIDAEESAIQHAIHDIALICMRRLNSDSNISVFNTYQMYRKDSLDTLANHIAIAKSAHFGIGVKLVRGAYLEHELRSRSGVTYDSKTAVDKSYDGAINAAMTDICGKSPNTSLLVATHNTASIEYTCRFMAKKASTAYKNRLGFAQLLGMGDHITTFLASEGFRTYKHVPFGPLEYSMPYLQRRIRENAAAKCWSRDEAELQKRALVRKVAGFFKR